MSTPTVTRSPQVKPPSHDGGTKPAPTERENVSAKRELRKWVYLLIACVLVVFVSAILAFAIERDFGKVDVNPISLIDDTGAKITGKIFKPVAATAKNKAPAILNLHGGNNDKDTQDPISLELARRGFVVVAVDGYGQGDSQGYLSIEETFRNPAYTQGRISGFTFLTTLPFVDTNKLGITGHSMGGGDAFKIANMNPSIKSAVLVQGGGGIFKSKVNVLYVQPTMSDMGGAPPVTPEIDPTWCGQAKGTTLTWETTYGNVADGTACKTTLVPSDHHLLTIMPKSVAETVKWFQLTLQGGGAGANSIDPNDQVYMWKEIFGLIALLVTIFSLIPLTNILLATSFFNPVAQPMPNRHAVSTRSWWVFATINALIAGITYPYLTAMAGPLGGVESVLPFMKLGMGNGVAVWMLVNVVICLGLFFFWYRNAAKKEGITMYDMGVSFDQERTKFDWRILGKTLLLGAILFTWMYVLEGISQWALGEEFRFSWPMMRQFSSNLRFGSFLLYLVPAVIFFVVNGGLFLFGQIKQNEYGSPAKTQFVWWLKVLYAALFGLFLVWFIQYGPWMLFQTGGLLPGIINSGGPTWAIMPLELFVWLPEFIVLLFMLTWFYRRTGRVYLGALMIASVLMWFFAAGSQLNI